MKKFTTNKYWDERWANKGANTSKIWKVFVSKLKELLGNKWEDYSETTLWRYIYDSYLPKEKDLKVVEIGSAPGWNLVQFKRRRGYDPYGIEYSHVGAERNRKKFKTNNIPESNVIEGDFFDDAIHKKYKEYFDIVMSGGFIEHFDDVKGVVQKHLDLLKPGGYLIITIPNFQGMNSFLAQLFYPTIKQTHNFDIMSKQSFQDLFSSNQLEEKYCNYFGTLYFGVFVFDYKNNGVLKYYLYRFLVRLQVILNVIFHLFLGTKGKESKFFSPYLIYVGQKK